jgi:hypothetical protein
MAMSTYQYLRSTQRPRTVGSPMRPRLSCFFYPLPPTGRNACAAALWRSGLSQNLVVLIEKARPEDIRTAFNRVLHPWAEGVGDPLSQPHARRLPARRLAGPPHARLARQPARSQCRRMFECIARIGRQPASGRSRAICRALCASTYGTAACQVTPNWSMSESAVKINILFIANTTIGRIGSSRFNTPLFGTCGSRR